MGIYLQRFVAAGGTARSVSSKLLGYREKQSIQGMHACAEMAAVEELWKNAPEDKNRQG